MINNYAGSRSTIITSITGEVACFVEGKFSFAKRNRNRNFMKLLNKIKF